MSAKWPSAVATDADLYTAVNLLQTTLSGNINNSVATITLASSTGFPTAGAVTIDNEVIFYTGVSGANLTGCVRGSDGTTAASHNSGVPVGATIVAFHHNGLMAEIEALETDLHTRLGFGSTLITMPTGSATNPTLVWSGDTTSGFSRGSVGETIWSSQGVGTWYFEVNSIQGPNGAAATPTFSIFNDPNTGMYSKSGDDLGFATGGVLRFDISTTAMTATLPSYGPNGNAAGPTYTFSSDPDTGMYRVSANELLFACGGSLVFGIETNCIQILDGTAAVPGITFINDPDSGMYRIGANNIALGTNGTRALEITSSQAVKIKGTSTNDSATAGDVGEVISSAVAFTNFPTSGQYGDLTSISLTAGDWMVSAQLIQIQNGATVATATIGVSSTSGNSGTGLTDGDTQNSFVPQNTASGAGYGGVFKHVQLSATTTYYLKYTSSYTVATPQAAGKITAVRIR